jgi:hypothetical protein
MCVVLGGLAVFQLLLAMGAPLGRFAWGGQHRVLPASLRRGSIAAIVIYGIFAVLILRRAGLLSFGLAEGVVTVATWVVTAYLLVGVGMNLASPSRPERFVMTPISALLFALCLVVALG